MKMTDIEDFELCIHVVSKKLIKSYQRALNLAKKYGTKYITPDIQFNPSLNGKIAGISCLEQKALDNGVNLNFIFLTASIFEYHNQTSTFLKDCFEIELYNKDFDDNIDPTNSTISMIKTTTIWKLLSKIYQEIPTIDLWISSLPLFYYKHKNLFENVSNGKKEEEKTKIENILAKLKENSHLVTLTTEIVYSMFSNPIVEENMEIIFDREDKNQNIIVQSQFLNKVLQKRGARTPLYIVEQRNPVFPSFFTKTYFCYFKGPNDKIYCFELPATNCSPEKALDILSKVYLLLEQSPYTMPIPCFASETLLKPKDVDNIMKLILKISKGLRDGI